MAPPSPGKLLGAAFVLLGGLLLVVSLFSPWYSFDQGGTFGPSATPVHNDTSYYLGLSSWNGTVRGSCSAGVGCPNETSYSAASLNHTGAVAGATLLLVSAGSALGLVAGTLGLVGSRKTGWTSLVLILASAAVVLAILAPELFAAALPGAYSADTPYAGAQSPSVQFGLGGPWSSFWGSGTGVTPDGVVQHSWGPSLGWFLSIVAFVAFLIGTVVLFLYRPETTTEPAPPSAPSPPGHPGGENLPDDLR